MLKGIDISHWNPNPDYKTPDFIIMKATEGIGYVDRMMAKHLEGALSNHKLIGFYHYARPEYNDPISEADHFIKAVGGYAGSAIFALDWEGEALKYPIEWAVQWLQRVEAVTGVKPLIYCSASYTKNLQPVLDNGNGLWVAHYTKNKNPSVKVYPFWAIWQYTSSPLDMDYFNGTALQFRKYCEKVKK